MDTTLRPPFTVTSSAIHQIETLGGTVFVNLENGGCCGTAYSYSIPTPQQDLGPATVRFGCPGAWLLVSSGAEAALRGATLDYGARLKPPRFRILRNPNTPDVCPCRRSFGSPWPGPGASGCRSYLPMPWDMTFDPPAAWKRQTGRDHP